jgi:hypothetical protein
MSFFQKIAIHYPLFNNCKDKKEKLIYDSHETIPELPEFVNRPLIKKYGSALKKPSSRD